MIKLHEETIRTWNVFIPLPSFPFLHPSILSLDPPTDLPNHISVKVDTPSFNGDLGPSPTPP